MKTSKLIYLFLAILISFIGTLSLLAPSSPRPVNAQDAPSATPPRNVFVNAEGQDGCEADNSEHIRFGRDNSHFFQFLGKKSAGYKVSTKIFSTDSASVSIDTKLIIYRNNPITHANQQPLAQNDDKVPVNTDSSYESELEFLAAENRQYWIEVQNLVNEGRGSYCLEVKAIETTGLKGPDKCEFNNTITTACEIEIVAQLVPAALQTDPAPFAAPQGITSTSGSYQYNFVPTGSEDIDRDFYKLWVKKNQHYVCQTYDLSSGTDTNMVFFDQYGKDFEPNRGNDDIAPGNYASKLSITATYTGWLHILVNPHDNIDRNYADRYTYRLYCVNEVSQAVEQSEVHQPDRCEINDSFSLASACQIFLKKESESKLKGIIGKTPVPGFNDTDSKKVGENVTILNFAPWSSGIRDVDHYKLWSKRGWKYVCYTQGLINGNDTKMSMYYYHGEGNGSLTPGDNPNDDYQPDVSLDSRVEINYRHTVDGWLIIKVEPAMEYIFEDGGHYQYQLTCEAFAPPNAPLTNLNGEEGTEWEATRDPYSTTPTPTAPVPAADQNTLPSAQASAPLIASVASTPEAITVALAASRPVNVSFVALSASLPTPTPRPMTQSVEFTLQLYYDQNNNQLKETGEGVNNMPIHIYTGLIETPLETTTNSGGAIFFKGATSNGRVLVVIPYLGIRREIAVDGASDIRLRIAP